MAFQVSPGVQVNEIDLTTVVPAAATSIGGFAGAFNWGPADSITLVSNEKELAQAFGAPTTDATIARSFLTAASFLKYGNSLKVVRSVGSAGRNAVVSGTAVAIKNREAYDTNYADGQGSVGAWAAKYVGALGNSLKVSVCPSATAFETWTYRSSFTAAPGTSASATGAGSSNDEMHIVVVDEDGAWTGTPNTIVEKFSFVSQAKDALKEDGTTNYYKNVVNATSKYIYWMDHDTNLTKAGQSIFAAQNFGGYDSNITNSLASGVDANPTGANVSSSLDLFSNADNVDVDLLFTAGDASTITNGVITGETTLALAAIAIATARKDCVAFVSPPVDVTAVSSDPLTDVTTWNTSLGANSSYAVIDSTALKVYDKYNDVYRWITAAGHIAGLCANTDRVADAWWSPAGTSRGALLGVTKLAFNPSKAQRDTLFSAGINPIISTPGEGTILFGDKTSLKKPSAFDAINVRRLFIVLEKSISRAAKAQLFEFNDEFTRASFRNAVEPFLRDIQGRRGITDFKVVCDATNNTGDIIDRNEFRADIYIKPARAIRYITLSFIATRTGVQFSEIVGNAAA